MAHVQADGAESAITLAEGTERHASGPVRPWEAAPAAVLLVAFFDFRLSDCENVFCLGSSVIVWGPVLEFDPREAALLISAFAGDLLMAPMTRACDCSHRNARAWVVLYAALLYAALAPHADGVWRW